MRVLTMALALTLLPLAGCDAIDSVRGMMDPEWKPENANGDDGVLHFGVNPWAMKIGDVQSIRVERVEHRSIKRPNAEDKEQERERKVRVLTARCESKSICDATPHDSDAREITITPKMMGMTKVYVSVSLDEVDTVKDAITIKVEP
jgi:hypothetical protein